MESLWSEWWRIVQIEEECITHFVGYFIADITMGVAVFKFSYSFVIKYFINLKY